MNRPPELIGFGVLVVLFGLFGCSQPESSPSANSATDDSATSVSVSVIHPQASRLVDSLKKSHFECAGHGRELYPLYYECQLADLSMYLYADDRGQVEGIRVFGPKANQREWVRNALDLITQQADSLSAIFPEVLEKADLMIANDLVLEWEPNGQRSIFRISPVSALKK